MNYKKNLEIANQDLAEQLEKAMLNINRRDAEITQLLERIGQLQEALKPFTKIFLYPDDLPFEHAEDIRSDPDWDEDANDMKTEDVFILRRDIRRARRTFDQAKS